MDANQNLEAWVSETVAALRNAQSWTGRIHIHKLLFVVDALRLAAQPFEFELYQYGPYSRELDQVVSSMEMFGQLDREYPREGYGPRYSIAVGSLPALPGKAAAAIRRVANAFGRRSGKELELIATLLWVDRLEGVKDEPKLLARVAQIKPQYPPDEIKRASIAAQRICDALKS